MRYEKLKKNSDFRTVYRRGRSISNYNLVLYTYKNSLGKNRLGISVSKKVGNSVVRNRIRRLISENFRLNEYRLIQGYDLVFIARSNSKGKNYRVIGRSVLDLLKRAGVCETEKVKH